MFLCFLLSVLQMCLLIHSLVGVVYPVYTGGFSRGMSSDTVDPLGPGSFTDRASSTGVSYTATQKSHTQSTPRTGR